MNESIERARPYRLFGRRTRDGKQRLVCMPHQQVPAGTSWFVDSGSRVLVFDSVEGQMIAKSPFGEFIYNNNDRDKIADQLIRLAGSIRREGK